jgi:hypothetical protein
MKDPLGFIPPHGNYSQLQSYRKAEIVYDLTYRFCQRFLSQKDRTVGDRILAIGRSVLVGICRAAVRDLFRGRLLHESRGGFP